MLICFDKAERHLPKSCPKAIWHASTDPRRCGAMGKKKSWSLWWGDLHQYLKGKGALHPSTAINFVLDISRGMAYLHNEPNVIIHRDLKPRNVLLVNSSTNQMKDLMTLWQVHIMWPPKFCTDFIVQKLSIVEISTQKKWKKKMMLIIALMIVRSHHRSPLLLGITTARIITTIG